MFICYLQLNRVQGAEGSRAMSFLCEPTQVSTEGIKLLLLRHSPKSFLLVERLPIDSKNKSNIKV